MCLSTDLTHIIFNYIALIASAIMFILLVYHNDVKCQTITTYIFNFSFIVEYASDM